MTVDNNTNVLNVTTEAVVNSTVIVVPDINSTTNITSSNTSIVTNLTMVNTTTAINQTLIKNSSASNQTVDDYSNDKENNKVKGAVIGSVLGFIGLSVCTCIFSVRLRRKCRNCITGIDIEEV